MGETTQGRTGNWANRPGGETTRSERESGRNDSGANGKVGETTRIRFYRILYSDDLQIYTYRKHLSDIGFKVSKIHLKIRRFFFGSVYYKCTESYFYKKNISHVCRNYCKNHFKSDTKNICSDHPKIRTGWLYRRVMHPGGGRGGGGGVLPY